MLGALRVLKGEERAALSLLKDVVSSDDLKLLRTLVRRKKAFISTGRFRLADDIDMVSELPIIHPGVLNGKERPRITNFIKRVNHLVEEEMGRRLFSKVSYKPWLIARYVKPSISALLPVRKALLAQLFSDNLNILIAAPAAIRAELSKSAESLFPSATSYSEGGSLLPSFSREGVKEGLLGRANDGLLIINDICRIKRNEWVYLKKANNSKKFIFEKKGRKLVVESSFSFLALCEESDIKRGLICGRQLTDIFHLIFVVRTRGRPFFEGLSAEDIDVSRFINAYVLSALRIKPEFSGSLKDEVASFVERLSDEERGITREVSPLLAVSAIRLAKAIARMKLSKRTNREDLAEAFQIIETSLSPIYV